MNIIDNAEGLLICLYVAPPHGEGEYKNKIVQENFNALKDAGVDVVMGCNEAFSAPLDESECFKSLDMCAKTGLKYFVLDELNMRYAQKDFQDSDRRREKEPARQIRRKSRKVYTARSVRGRKVCGRIRLGTDGRNKIRERLFREKVSR